MLIRAAQRLAGRSGGPDARGQVPYHVLEDFLLGRKRLVALVRKRNDVGACCARHVEIAEDGVSALGGTDHGRIEREVLYERATVEVRVSVLIRAVDPVD